MLEELSFAAANGMWLASFLPAHLAFRRAVKNPKKAQAAILERLLRQNAGCAYGKRWQFSRLRGRRDFQNAVPIATYDDLAPWMRRMTDGEPDVLTSERVLMFEKTSGSSDSAKYIPYTASLNEEFRTAIGAWMCDLYRHHPKLLTGNSYWSLTPLARKKEYTKGGRPVGFENDAEYFSGWQRKLLNALMAVPNQTALISDLTGCLYVTLRFLLQSPSLAFVSVWSPTFLNILLDQLRLHGGRLCCDLRDGELRPPSLISIAELKPLKKYLRADPVRAALLRGILLRDGPIATQELWPNLRVISCWADASSRLAVPAIQESFPGSPIQGKGLLATEGVVSIPICSAQGSVAAVTSHFFEFLEKDSATPRLLHELELGREYSVLLTTGGGLWRYRLGDRIRVTGFLEQTPILEFLGREGIVSDVCGEKLSAAFVDSVLLELESERACTPGFAMLAPSFEQSPRYVLFFHGRIETGRFAELLDAKLRRNPHYDYCRKLGQLSPPAIFQITEGAGEAYTRRCSALGQRAGNVKETPLHRLSGWEDHFQGFLLENGGQLS
jgi:GH3 auxin-responsive promoter